jgi:hypothetical protein
MSIIAAFAGRFSALDYAYGILPAGGPALQVGTGNSTTGSSTITVLTAETSTMGGEPMFPITTNTPITVGIGSNAETVTPTSVGTPSLSGAAPGYLSVTVTASFSNLHGPQEPVTSGTYGLQEAINAANGIGGGLAVISNKWYSLGGTTAIIQAAALPTTGVVAIEDNSRGLLGPGVWANSAGSLTVLAVPATATSAMVASQTGVVGTWTAGTVHAVFTYVTANGGETLTSADYSFTAVVSLAIGGPGPAAATGAVGYRVYLSTVGGSTDYLVPVTAANGTVVQCGPITAFKIGTAFSVAAPVTSALALVPAQSTAFGTVQPMFFASPNMAQVFQTVSGPFAVTGTVTAGTAAEWGKVQLPTGFLNQINRKIRLTLEGYYTPVSTATLIITVAIQSVYGTTTTTIFTVTTPASSGTTAANINGVIDIATSATGATGTVECHGYLIYGGATGTAGLLVAAGDSVITVSSAADLTKQDAIVININSGTANLTTSQLRRLIVEVLQ